MTASASFQLELSNGIAPREQEARAPPPWVLGLSGDLAGTSAGLALGAPCL